MKRQLFNQFVEWVCNTFSMQDPSEVFKKNRKTELVAARHLIYYLCYKRDITVMEIIRYMDENGYKIDYPSVKHGIESVSKKVKKDNDYKILVSRIQKAVSFETQDQI